MPPALQGMIAYGQRPNHSVIHKGFSYTVQTDSQLLSLTNRAEEWGECSSHSHKQEPHYHFRNQTIINKCWDSMGTMLDDDPFSG